VSDGARGDRGLRLTTGMSRGERWFRSLVENAYEVITILEADGTIRYLSPAVERVLGYRSEELTGTSVLDLIYPDDKEQALSILAEVRRAARAPQERGLRPRPGLPYREAAVGRRGGLAAGGTAYRVRRPRPLGDTRIPPAIASVSGP
jgi:PAS domain-containing protein